MSLVSEQLFHILLVEDDDNHADLARLAMDDAELVSQLDRVKDGVEAIAYLRREHPFESVNRPDIILLDLQLPKMNGHEVLSIIRNDPALSSIPIIVLTTSESEMDIHKAYAHCANSYLVKPVDFESFNQMINDCQRYWSVWNRA